MSRTRIDATPNTTQVSRQQERRRIGGGLAAFVLLFSAIALSPVPALAEEPEANGDPKYLLSDSGPRYFGGPVLRSSRMVRQVGVLVGGRGGTVFGDRLAFGGAGYALVNPVHADNHGSLSLGYGGLFTEFFLFARQAASVSIGLQAGLGGLGYRDAGRKRRSTSVFILEPEVHVELNLTPTARLALGATHRYLSGVPQGAPVTAAQLSAPTASVMLKFSP